MSAESSWTLLKVIWQSCTDRFPNEIDPSIHTTPTFVEQPFRISFSLPLPSSPFLSRSDPVHLRFDARFDAPSAQLPLQQFTKLSSFPRRGNFLEETCLLVFGRDSSSSTPYNSTTFHETILLIAGSISISKISRWIHFSKFLRKILSWTKNDSLGTSFLGNFGEFLNLLRNLQAHLC